MDTEQALALARINQARVYTIWFGLGGNSALVARATGLSPSIIDALAHDYHWHQIAGGKLGLEDKKVEREINRYTSLPSLLELESSVSHRLLNPTPYRRNLVNDYLEGLNRRSGSR